MRLDLRKTSLCTCKIINKFQILFKVLYLRKENRCLHAIHHSCIANPITKWIAAWIACLFRVFYWCSKYYKHSYRGWGAMKCRQKLCQHWKQPNRTHFGISAPHSTQSSWIHDQTHQPAVWWIIGGWLLVKGRCSHLKHAPKPSWMSENWDSDISHIKSSLETRSTNTCLNC